MEGKMTHGKAILMIIFIYMYATPFVVACVTESWGRFVPGKYGWRSVNERYVYIIIIFTIVLP